MPKLGSTFLKYESKFCLFLNFFPIVQYEENLMSSDTNKSDFANGLFQSGKMFNSSLELFSHQESCNNNESNQYEESLMSDTNETDFANGLNTSNSSGDERKVRVRTLISDEQLSILKTYYNHNPRYEFMIL